MKDLNGFRPMLGAKVERVNDLRFPLLGSPKYDGIRAIWWEGQFYSRTLKPIPNKALSQRARELRVPSGWEGELLEGSPTSPQAFPLTSSRVMTHGGTVGNCLFYAFDALHDLTQPFRQRMRCLQPITDFVVKVPQTMLHTPAQVADYEAKMVEAGYEGVILRSLDAPYKMGRSTLNEQGLLKLKRFMDAEAIVVDFEEKMHNTNEAKLDERGYSKRSSHKENQRATGQLGALVVQWQGRRLGIGSGFTDAQRATIWAAREEYLGRLAKFKYAPLVRDLPRHPVFLGWRHEDDV